MFSSISRFWRVTRFSAVITVLIVASSQANYTQPADPDGWAVPSYSKPVPLTDDWVSPFTGPITEINFWVAWQGDIEGFGYLPATVWISSDTAPAWSNFDSGDTQQDLPAGTVDQGWYSPEVPGLGISEEVIQHDHTQLRRLSITDLVDAPTVQAGQRYWIMMYVATMEGAVGWSTAETQSGSPATYVDPADNEVHQLLDPVSRAPLDMAFEIVPEPSTLLLGVLGGWLIVRRSRRP